MTTPGPDDDLTVTEKAVADLDHVWGQLGPRSVLGLKRRALLPTWIKAFSYLYLVVAGAIPPLLLYSLFGQRPYTLSIYGIRYVTDHLDPLALLLALVIGGCGAAAYGLLWGRSWGITAGLVVGGLGLALSVWSLFLYPGTGFHLPLEPFLLVPFMISLWNRQRAWNEAAGD